MKIESSSIQLASQHATVTQHEVQESLRMWVGDHRPDFEGRDQSISPGCVRSDAVHLSQAAREAQPSKELAPDDAELLPEDALKLGILLRMIETLTGKKVKLVSPKGLHEAMGKIQEQTQGCPILF